MAWRNQGITGSNNIPLGPRRRFGGDTSTEDRNSEATTPDFAASDLKRGRSPARGKSTIMT